VERCFNTSLERVKSAAAKFAILLRVSL
jgi:hypothetical protein